MTDQAHPATIVRLATAHDEQAIMELCHMLHGENGVFAMSDDHVRNILASAFRRQGGIIGVIDGDDGQLEGCILLTIQRMWYSDQFFLDEMFSFVRPDRRGRGQARALIEFAKGAADKIGVPLLIGIISNQRTEAKVRLYQRQLGAPAGAFFLYGARSGEAVQQH